MEMELELGLALPTTLHHQPLLDAAAGGEFGGGQLLSGSEAGACGTKKRVFGDAFVVGAAKATLLPLFVLEDGDGGGGGGGGDREDGVDHEPSNKKKRLVGWPPVKCARRRSCDGGGGYVKVKMEGVAIGRKVHVSLHGSYQELLRTLERMFPSANQQGAVADHAEEEEVACSHESRRLHHPYVVTYEDGEGDWLLVGDDVPWEVFVRSVKRLKILA